MLPSLIIARENPLFPMQDKGAFIERPAPLYCRNPEARCPDPAAEGGSGRLVLFT
jgi:hypothetical protein